MKKKEEIAEKIEEVKGGKFGDTFCFLGVVVSIVGLIFSVLESIFHAIEVVGPVYVFVATNSLNVISSSAKISKIY